ncbi:MAG: heat shock protein DnaJ protein [Hydrocarboniphaga sp.]|uniref:J domain-containing protein n=1 Tax=Hydrocarboniphaga sp. TaxID=2033016 RepID=UPI0026070603|nr:J domain-containing protein [Hydrocarboniphaga sp.]MDB5967819.1 heat shock protein DnaJ protein [Hydrocarboniphaga sp.]
MKQASLFDNDRSVIPVNPGVAGSQPILGKEQKLFNKLIAQIEALRQSVQQWRDYGSVYQRRYADEIAPLNQQLRDARIAMVGLLDQAMNSRELGKKQRDKVRDIVLGQLSELLGESADAELLRLYEKHSDFPFGDSGDGDFDDIRAMAGEIFGIEIDPEHSAASPEELAELIAEQVDASRQDEPPRANKARKKNAKAAARDASREQAEQGASQSIREIYRKLVSELHPDREQDAEQRARKTELMQQVNQAYEARDLLALLQLQLRIEQIGPDSLAGLAQERLRHYNFVLKEQFQRLQQEQLQLMDPFLLMMGGRMSRGLTTDDVQRAMDADIREMKAALKYLKADLASFRDIRNLKASLRDYRIGQADEDDELDMMLSQLMSQQRRRRR